VIFWGAKFHHLVTKKTLQIFFFFLKCKFEKQMLRIWKNRQTFETTKLKGKQ
jgi:hypothetical protein